MAGVALAVPPVLLFLFLVTVSAAGPEVHQVLMAPGLEMRAPISKSPPREDRVLEVIPESTPDERFLARFRRGEPFALARYNGDEWQSIRDWLGKYRPANRERLHALRAAFRRGKHPNSKNGPAWPCQSAARVQQPEPCSERLSRSMLRALTRRSEAPVPPADGYIFQSSFNWDGWGEDLVRWGLRQEDFQQEDIVHNFVRSDVAGLEAWAHWLRAPIGHTVLVAPCSYRPLAKPLGVRHFLEVPRLHVDDNAAHSTVVRVQRELKTYLNSEEPEKTAQTVILFSAGMLANVIIDELFEWAKGRYWLIDIGSAFDILLDDSSVDLFRLPDDSPSRWRSAISNPSQETIERLKYLLPPDRRKLPDVIVKEMIKGWLGPDGQGLEAGSKHPSGSSLDFGKTCEFNWTQKLSVIAERGSLSAIEALGYCHQWGHGLRKDRIIEERIKRVHEAEATHQRARELTRDSRDHKQALSLFRQAAAAGHGAAAGHLAQMLLDEGAGPTEAREWFIRAAQALYSHPSVAAQAKLKLCEIAFALGEAEVAKQQCKQAERIGFRNGEVGVAHDAAWNLAVMASATDGPAAASPHFARAAAHGFDPSSPDMMQLCGADSSAGDLVDACWGSPWYRYRNQGRG